MDTFLIHDARLTTEQHTGRIRVLAPCNCEACASGARWFQCYNMRPVDRRTVALYQTPPREYDAQEPDVAPSPAAIALVRSYHPHDDLLYLGD